MVNRKTPTFATGLAGSAAQVDPARPARDRLSPSPSIPLFDEALVVDGRSGRTPAQMVEEKLSRILKEAALPISHLQMRGLLRER